MKDNFRMRLGELSLWLDTEIEGKKVAIFNAALTEESKDRIIEAFLSLPSLQMERTSMSNQYQKAINLDRCSRNNLRKEIIEELLGKGEQ